MKKLFIIMFTVFLNGAFFSCTPEHIVAEDQTQATDCCGEDGDIDPPPPPPPPSGGKNSQGGK
ncbi:hypothetical protein N7U66_07570 [Lacinutrix neustonica]|uniref:Lipoprotein n=1 Tax=Lacinutrix neustonica TaxID=2980107 RepID=A0A9E8MXA1_9FLAO|nr:hypothetical protein [Lacinutrix neustonica]WAC03382.1 hypothetical protein N7U66_07570 [Lacinutrix neustonica]